MDKKILANEIKKEITTAEKLKWNGLGYAKQDEVLKDLRKKYKIDDLSENLDHVEIRLELGKMYKGTVRAVVYGMETGAMLVEEAKQFAEGVLKATDALGKAVAELKKQYPDVKITKI